MRIGGSEFGGLAGGLYGVFEAFGRLFFAMLIGADRAKRHALEYAAVTVGSLSLGLPTGVVVWIGTTAKGWDLDNRIVLSILAAVLWLGIAQIPIAYVKSLRVEEVRSSPRRDFRRPFDEIALEKQRELEGRGYPRREAEREAYWFAFAKEGCFIATAVYGNQDAPEVKVLRAFRERSLLESRRGRFLVAAYEYFGPVAAIPVRKAKPLRIALKAILNALVEGLGRRGYGA